MKIVKPYFSYAENEILSLDSGDGACHVFAGKFNDGVYVVCELANNRHVENVIISAGSSREALERYCIEHGIIIEGWN